MKLVWIKLIPWNWKNRITIASKKIARVTAALEQGLGLRLLRTDIDKVFHPLEKRTNKRQKPRWIWILWEMNDRTPLKVMYRKDGIWFSRRQDLWDEIRSLLSFHSSDLKRHFPPTFFITLRLILEYMSEHMDAHYSHLFPPMSTNCFQQWRILKGNPKRNRLMTTQMLPQYLNRGRISYLMAYALSAKKQQYSWYRSILMIHAAASWETIKTIDGYFLTSLIKMIKLN